MRTPFEHVRVTFESRWRCLSSTTVQDGRFGSCSSVSEDVRRRRLAMKSKRSGRKYGKGASRSVERAMRERKEGKLRSGKSHKKVASRPQAIAIGLSEARRAGKKVPDRRALGANSPPDAAVAPLSATYGSPSPRGAKRLMRLPSGIHDDGIPLAPKRVPRCFVPLVPRATYGGVHAIDFGRGIAPKGELHAMPRRLGPFRVELLGSSRERSRRCDSRSGLSAPRSPHPPSERGRRAPEDDRSAKNVRCRERRSQSCPVGYRCARRSLCDGRHIEESRHAFAHERRGVTPERARTSRTRCA